MGVGRDREPMLTVEAFQRRLKPRNRCSLEHLGRDFASYRERRAEGNDNLVNLVIGYCV